MNGALTGCEWIDGVPVETVAKMDTIAAEINAIKRQVCNTVLSASIDIGLKLKAAKALVPYGHWGIWLTANVAYSERTAQNLMRVAEEYDGKAGIPAYSGLSLSGAVALLGLEDSEKQQLLEELGGEASTRDLQEAVKALRNENERMQVKMDDLIAETEAAREQEGIEVERAAEAARKADLLRAELARVKEKAKDAMADAAAAREEAARAKDVGAVSDKEIQEAVAAASQEVRDTKAELEKARAEAAEKEKLARDMQQRAENALESAKKAREEAERLRNEAEAAKASKSVSAPAVNAQAEGAIALREALKRMRNEYVAALNVLRTIRAEDERRGATFAGVIVQALDTMRAELT